MYMVETVLLDKTVVNSPRLRCYGTILSLFDRQKRMMVREVRMLRIENGVRKVLKEIIRTARR
jgi:hypothetical protein